MIKVYRKTATIKAEQFDNSREMAEKYHVEYNGASYILPFRIDTPKGWLGIKVGDWIVADDDGKYWPIADDVFKKTYAELPVIPKEIDEHIRWCKGEGGVGNVSDAMEYAHGDVASWIYDERNSDTFARAWLDGYQVEEEHD